LKPSAATDEGADGRHREVAGLGIGELQFQAVAGVPLVANLGLLERLAGVMIGIVEDRRGPRRALLVDRKQVVAVAGKAVAGGAGDLLLILIGSLGKRGVEELHHRDVEPVSQNIGSLVSLEWSCQVIDGVMTKSPGCIAVRSPSTAA
jgi:hypothetical protein